jgi:hypothetical protein
MSKKAVKLANSKDMGPCGPFEERFRAQQERTCKIIQGVETGPFMMHFVQSRDGVHLTSKAFGKEPKDPQDATGGITMSPVQASARYLPPLLHSFRDITERIRDDNTLTIDAGLMSRNDENCVLMNVLLDGAPPIEYYDIFIGRTRVQRVYYPTTPSKKLDQPISILGSIGSISVQAHEIDLRIEVKFMSAPTKIVELLLIHQGFLYNFDQVRKALLTTKGHEEVREQFKAAQNDEPKQVVDTLHRGMGVSFTTPAAVQLTAADGGLEWVAPAAQKNRFCAGFWVLAERSIADSVQSFHFLSSDWKAKLAMDSHDSREPRDFQHYFVSWGNNINLLDATGGAGSMLLGGEKLRVKINGSLDAYSGKVRCLVLWVDLYQVQDKKARLLTEGEVAKPQPDVVKATTARVENGSADSTSGTE